MNTNRVLIATESPDPGTGESAHAVPAIVIDGIDGIGATDGDGVEDVVVDDDVSAADLTGEVVLPATEDILPLPPLTPLPFMEEAAPVDGAILDVTAPRVMTPVPPVIDRDRAPITDKVPLGTPAPETPPSRAPAPAGIREFAAALVKGEDPIEARANESGNWTLQDEPSPLPGPSEGALSGSAAVVPVIDVLGLLSRQGQTGVLEVFEEGEGGRRVEIVLLCGRVALARGTGFPELRLGRFVLELETVSQPEIDQLEGRRPQQRGPGTLLGQRLCEVGYLTKDDVRQVLANQTRELFYAALRLTGRFCFSQPAELPSVALDPSLGAGLGLDVEGLLLEGYRRIQDYAVLERDIEEGTVYLRTEERGAERLGLTREEQQVLQLCTGRPNILDMARETQLVPLEVARVLRRLEALRFVRRRLRPTVV